jgi:lipopolysaccharide biosynthesis protein
VGLTECPSPVRHVQSFFLVFNATALRSTGVRRIFQCMVSLPTKEQVIDVYETRLTQALTQHGLRCEALFCASSGELQSADDTSYRWAQLIRAGFPYFKTRVLAKLGDNRQVKSLVPAAFLRPDD